MTSDRRPIRRRRGARCGVALVTAGLIVSVCTPDVAARDTTEVANCSDGQTFCSSLTVERPTTGDPTPGDPTPVGLNESDFEICGPILAQSNGDISYDLCNPHSGQVMSVTATPLRPRPRPTQSSVISSAMGALNPPAPTIHTSPGHRSGLLVQTPTWLWLSPSYWRTYSTTIVLWGYVVTIFATPTVVRWNMGNGDSITCVGPGTPWIPGFSDALSTCRYTYRHSSDGAAGDRYRITATVTFVGSFTTVGLGGMRGPLGAITRSSSIRAQVAEIQGLVV